MRNRPKLMLTQLDHCVCVLNLTVQIHEQIIETGVVLIMHSHTKLLHGFRRFEISVTWATCMILYIAFVSFFKLESFSFHSTYSMCTAKVQPRPSQSVIQFWNNMTVIKWWQNVPFHVNYPFKCRKSMWPLNPLLSSASKQFLLLLQYVPFLYLNLSNSITPFFPHFPQSSHSVLLFSILSLPPPLCAHSLAVSNHSALIPAASGMS